MPNRKVSRAFEWATRMSTSKREEFLGRVFRRDPEARRALRDLVESHEKAGSFLSGNAVRDLRHLIGTAPSPLELSPGERIDDFVILRQIGAGASGRVYLASQISLSRTVVLKVIPDAGREAHSLAQLDHENIVRVFSETVLPERGVRLICMPHVPGSDLQKILGERAKRNLSHVDGAAFLKLIEATGGERTPRSSVDGTSPIDLIFVLGVQLAEALAYAHARGLLHLDVKPANILVASNGTPLLLDFSIAARQGAGAAELMGGTARYMAPEQKRMLSAPDTTEGLELDARSDVYSLGVVLQDLLAANRAGSGGPRAEQELRSILARCTSADRDARPASAEALAEALRGCRQIHALERQLPIGKNLQRIPAPLLGAVLAMPGWLPIALAHGFAGFKGPLPLVAFGVTFALSLRGARLIGAALASPGSPRDRARARRWALAIPSLSGVFVVFTSLVEAGILFLELVKKGPFGQPQRVLWLMNSQTLTSAIALSVTLIVAYVVALRIVYPRLWRAEDDLGTGARRELAWLTAQLRWFAVLAIAMPLVVGFRLRFPTPGESPTPFVASAFLIFAGIVTAGILTTHLLVARIRRGFVPVKDTEFGN